MTLASRAKVIANALLLRPVHDFRNWKMCRDWDRRARPTPRGMKASSERHVETLERVFLGVIAARRPVSRAVAGTA